MIQIYEGSGFADEKGFRLISDIVNSSEESYLYALGCWNI